MRNFQQVAAGLDVLPLTHALARQPGLWNRQVFRTTYKDTPHGDVDDIWLRFSPAGTEFDAVIEDTAPVWHEAAKALPQVKPLVLSIDPGRTGPVFARRKVFSVLFTFQ
jgi:hypothetical protein